MASRGRGGSSKHRGDEKVHVAIRCRPMNENERSNHVKTVVETNMREREIRVQCNNNQEKTYKFDKTFGPSSRQIDVYKSVVEPHIDEVLAGYNCTVLAYGQTGTGKTFTMEGERSGNEYTWENDPKAGIIPRTLSQLFDRLKKDDTEFSVHVSLLEIYNELIYDLLSPTAEPALRRIYDDASRKGSVIIADQTEIRVLDKSEVYGIMEQGAAKRRTDATLMNEFSSRSHSVFTITVHIKEHSKSLNAEEEMVKIGKLNLVDLAGSENIGRSGAVEQRAREAGNINMSLLTLGRCITALVDHAPHVPYRESRLTRILQDSLGGSTKTSIIATISPGSDNLEETLSTLDYASRAKNIQNKPKVNQRLTKRMLIKQYDNEIERLRRELIATREKNGICMDQKQYDAMTGRSKELESLLENRQEELDKYQNLFTNVSEELQVKSEEFSSLKQEFQQIHFELKNQSYLAKVKGEHAEKAVTDGLAVVEVTNEISQSIVKVHDKVDRLKEAEYQKCLATELHGKRIADEVSSLKALTQSFIDKNGRRLDTSSKAIDLRFKENRVALTKIEDMISEFRDMFDETVQNCRRTLSYAVSDLAIRTDDLNSCLSEKENMIDGILKKQQEMANKRLTEILKSTRHAIERASDIGKFIKKETKAHHDSQLKQVEAISEKVDVIIKQTQDEQDGVEAAVDLIRKQLDIITTRNSTITNTAASIKEDLKKVDHCTATTKQKLEVESNDAINKAENAIVDVENGLKHSIEQSVEDGAANCQIMWETIAEMRNVTANILEDQKDMEEKANTYLHDASELTPKFLTETTDVMNEMVDNNQKDMNDIKVTLHTVLDSEDATWREIADGPDKLNVITQEYCSAGSTQLQPTGQTPARKSYTYPKRFKHLSPDAKLLQSFHEMMKEEEAEEERRKAEEEEAAAVAAKEELEKDSTGSISTESLSEISSEDSENNVPCSGGMPFFMASKKQALSNGKTNSRSKPSKLPLRSAHNIR